MIFLPGIDGVGVSVEKQHPAIFEQFVFLSLAIPADDRTPFGELVEQCVAFCNTLAKMVAVDRPIYLVGESFGGILATAVAAKAKDAVDRLVLINPATSYADSMWPQVAPAIAAIPPQLYPLLPFALMPLIGNPLQMAAHRAILATGLGDKLSFLREDLIGMIPLISVLAEILPQETLVWKMQCLAEGSRYVRPLYPLVTQRTLIVVGDQDLMLPSSTEAKNLERQFRRARARVLKGGSHAMLLEAGVDIVKIMREEGFLVSERRMTGRSGAKHPKRSNNFGRPGPVELPTWKEFDDSRKSSELLASVVSPVCFATDAAGVVSAGLSALPITPGKPVLLVGNHSTVPVDLSFLVEKIYEEKKVLIRGLTHPAALAEDFNTTADESGGGAVNGGQGTRNNSFGNFLATWGAVPVGAKALHELLKDGECVLLFPGGAQEALKSTRYAEKYRLFWSSKPEFVRTAAKFGATIIPFGAVGAEDNVSAIAEAGTLKKLFPPDAAKQKRDEAFAAKHQARKGISRADESLSDSLASRLYVPSGLERYYYCFGKPFETSPAMYRDKEAIAAAYAETKQGVDGCIRYLLESRERDPYANIFKRVFYEKTTNLQAPTFEP